MTFNKKSKDHGAVINEEIEDSSEPCSKQRIQTTNWDEEVKKAAD